MYKALYIYNKEYLPFDININFFGLYNALYLNYKIHTLNIKTPPLNHNNV